MWCFPTLILGLDTKLHDNEVLMAKAIRQEVPDAPHQEIHVQSHDIRTGKHTMNVRVQKIRPREPPLRRRDGQKQVRKRTQPYLSAQISTMVIPIPLPSEDKREGDIYPYKNKQCIK